MRFVCRNLAISAVVFVFVGAIALGQQSPVRAPHKPIAPKIAPAKMRPMPLGSPRSVVAGPWFTDANLKASIYLKNLVVTSAVTVTPVLYLGNGTRYDLAPVTLTPSGTAVVDINAALQSKGIAPYATLYGYVEVQYTWAWDPVCVTIQDKDTVHSLIFTYGAQPLAGSPASNTPATQAQAVTQELESLWWKQENAVTEDVALQNTSGTAVNATVQTTDDHGVSLASHTVSISPHGTKIVQLVELNSASSSAGGVNVTYSGLPDTLLVNGGLEDRNTGYSASIGFQSPPPAGTASTTTTVAELGLMAGAADMMMKFPAGTVFTPYSVIRNVSDAPVSIVPTLWWMAGGSAKSAELPGITLMPGQTQRLDMASSLVSSGLAGSSESLNLVFQIQGERGALIFAGGSVDQTTSYVFEIVPRGIGESASKSIAYWSTANGDDTMVNLWNPADEAQDVIFQLDYTGGSYSLPVHLAARASQVLRVSDVIQGQAPDANGTVIPATVHVGSGRIMGNLTENQHILIGVDVGIYNVAKATCYQSCYICDGEVNAFVYSSPFTVPVGGMTELSFGDQWNTGNSYDLTAESYWSGYGGVAVGQNGVVTGVSVSSNSEVDVYDQSEPTYYYNVCTGGANPCPITFGVSGTFNGTVGDPTPSVTGIDPSDWPADGTSHPVTFSGTGFGTNPPTLTFRDPNNSDPNITYSLSYNDDSQIVASVTVPSGTPDEDITVSVTSNGYNNFGNSFYSGGGGESPTSPSANARVQSPSNSSEITVIGWIDANGPGLGSPLPTNGANPTLVSRLTNACATTLYYWATGIGLYLQSPNDDDYANRWLLANSSNPQPPNPITPSQQFSHPENFRAFNDFGHGTGITRIGQTPSPCGSSVVSNWVDKDGQPNPDYNGLTDTTSSGYLYKLVEGRVSFPGQVVSYTINNRTVAWVWALIEFDSSGNSVNLTNADTTNTSNYSTFPTFSVYINGYLSHTYEQSVPSDWIAKDDTWKRATPIQ